MKTRNTACLLLALLAVASCSDGGTDPQPTTLKVASSHTRITTPGRITFTVQPTEPPVRLEVFQGTAKVAEATGLLDPPSVAVSVTPADNGTRNYTVKSFAASGAVETSDPITVEVDIRWGDVRVLSDADLPGAIAWDASGGAYSKYHTPTPDISVLLRRYDAQGARVWERIYGGPSWEFSGSHGVDPSGRMYMAGTVTHLPIGGPTPPDCFLALYDAAGSLVWTRQMSTTDHERACVTSHDAAGNFYVAGTTGSGAVLDLFIAKFTADGALRWQRQYGAMGEPHHVVIDPLGGVYVSGFTLASVDGTPNRGKGDTFLAKFDTDGNSVWAKQYGTADQDGPMDLAADPDGGVYLAMYTDRFPGTEHPWVDAVLARYAPDGTLVWQRVMDGGNRDWPSAIAVNQEAVYLSGSASAAEITSTFGEPRQGGQDAFLARFTRSGTLQWVRLLGTPTEGTTPMSDLLLGPNGDVTLAVRGYDPFPGVTGLKTVIVKHREATP